MALSRSEARTHSWSVSPPCSLPGVWQRVDDNHFDAPLRCTLATVAQNNTVVFTATDSSSEFEELLRNWVCHLQRLQIPPLVWSLDAATHAKLGKWRGVRSVFTESLQLPEDAKPSAYKKPSSHEYTLAVSLKPLVVLGVVRHGFDVLFLDVDVALLADPRPWLHRSHSALQLSLNYDDRPVRQQVTGVPDLNTGVAFVRAGRAGRELVDKWARRTVERESCPHRPPLWACGDQEQLTKLLKACGWKPVSYAAAAHLDANDVQRVSCGGTIGILEVDVLPPRLFASGQSSALWPRVPGSRVIMAPRDVFSFHPNFGGFAGGVKKTMLQRTHFAGRGGGTGWCTDKQG
jgi:hypothetical protein